MAVINEVDSNEIDINYIEKNKQNVESALEKFKEKSGIYIFLAKNVIDFGSFEGKKFKIDKNKVCYIGKGEDLFKRINKQHVNNNGTGTSTLRRTLGAISSLKNKLGLKVYKRGEGLSKRDISHYIFNQDGETKLTKWIEENLDLSFVLHKRKDLKKAERMAINKYKPLLNIDKSNPFIKLLKKYRKNCRDEAKINGIRK